MKLILFFVFVFSYLLGYTQNSLLILDKEFPEPGQEITFTYEGRLANEGAKIDCIYYFIPKDYTPRFGIPISIENGKIVGKLNLPDSVKYVSLIVSNGKEIDTNNGQGFGINIFKDKKLIPGTLLAEGYSMMSLDYNAQNNLKRGVQLMEKDFELYPELKSEGFSFYVYLLSQNIETKSKSLQLAKDKYNQILLTGEGEQYGYFYSGVLSNWAYNIQDTLMRPIIERFPNGKTSFAIHLNKLNYLSNYQPDSALKYFNFIEEKFSNIQLNKRRLLYEKLLNAYANLGDSTGFLKYLVILNDLDKTKITQIISATTTHQLAVTLKSQNKLADALRFTNLAEEYFMQYDPLSRYYGYALETKAAIQFELGKVDEAIELKKKALRLTSTIFPDQNVVLLEYLAHAKRFEEVARYGQQFITTNSSNKQIDSLYAAALLVLPKEKQQQYATAFTEADRNFYKALDDKMLMEAISDFQLVDLTGKPVSLSDFKGKIVVLDFWAVWCKPCIESFGGMNELVQSYPKDEVQFLFIDITQENSEAVRIQKIKKILALQKVPNFDVLLDQNKAIGFQVYTLLNVGAIPEKLVIDREGKLRYRSAGFSTKEKLVKEMTYVISQVKNN